MSSPEIERLRASLAPLRQALVTHPVYSRIDDVISLRLFMEYHVFAVWDFMSLLKALQRSLTCVNVPWLPSPDAAACRFINEIVLAEESDQDGQGGYSSHFELYRKAMAECGADVTPIDRLVSAIRSGMTVDAAIDSAPIPEAIREFVRNTFALIKTDHSCAIAASFTFGREDLLPELFRRILDQSHPTPGRQWDTFRYYLDRHIELDSGEHGPTAERLVERLCGDAPDLWLVAKQAALRSLQARLTLWDAVFEQLEHRTQHSEPRKHSGSVRV